MRFLVIDRGGTIELPPAQGRNLFIEARDWVRERMDEGKVELAYAMSGQMSSVMVYNVSSNEELDDMLQEYPLSNYAVFEVYPLSDALHSYEIAAKSFMERGGMAA